ncbi:OTU domain-containing protein 5-B isoform X2 [Capsella rubella]|uniref:OTU domain-containing protein 5-B isoform X2 n=1 Tax=Capsella rubella TaxID=81985 RepID=UPI000CD4CD4D|nr:OTU domain-containing protein 5-B isoform X2 [Capsella rubella]
MTRILVQRGSSGSSSNSSRSSSSSGSASSSETEPQINNSIQVPPVTIDEEISDEKQDDVSVVDQAECSDAKNVVVDSDEPLDREDDEGLIVSDNVHVEREGIDCDSPVSGGSNPDLPSVPAPPPKPSSTINSGNNRLVLGSFGTLRIGPTRRGAGPRSLVNRSSPTGSHPSSPRSHSENEGYNSSDEHMPCYVSSHLGSSSGPEREHQFEAEIRESKGFEIRRMLEDGNCLFRAVADQVYGDSEAYDLARQLCMDYMEQERDHFSQFITEGFTSYLKRKRKDKVYGNNIEIQALAEMYNRPIHIYSYSTEPINIFQGNYSTDTPPIRLSFHHGNHYNSLVDPHRLTVGAGLGFSSLSGRHVDKEQVKAAIKAQQEHQIDNALLAEGRFYSDLELTEKEIERSVMEASRAEYLMEWSKPRIGPKESSTSNAETSSSGARPSGSDSKPEEAVKEKTVLSSSVEMVLSMGFSYTQAMEAYSIFGDDVDSMVCYVLETSCGGNNRRKGKATE